MIAISLLIPLLLLAYLLGSISFAILIARLYGLPDPRQHGSGNPGATNMLRTGKKSAAALTLLGDALKGVVAVLIANYVSADFGLPEFTPYLAALAAFLGHLYPVFFGFKGGKGVATALGVLLALNIWLGLLCVLTWGLVFLATRISSLSALIAASLAPLYGGWLVGGLVQTGLLAILSILVLIRHRENIRKLIKGKEGAFKKT